ncbi:MAG: deoxyribose-phosphate aldolase [Anaerococcus sp.]|nr:deoxyribose-phosphate aldolase [Peptoniphilaceae bacterium]MDY3055260.1 deoxyribose-phosphate aldolase [Anaerococcus sp.]
MKKEEIFKHIDHTLLKAFARWEDIEKLCDEAIKYKTASVCIPQTYIKRVKEKYGDKINICTVVGFPLGYNSTESKLTEVKVAIEDGANEIDMVVNIPEVKNGNFQKVEDEIRALKKACGEKILKVIIETCYLSEEEKIALCKAITEAGADYIKTSTGFGTDGAKIEDIRLFKKHIGENVKIKAAGGVKTEEDLTMFIEEGCDRIGTSSAIKLLSGKTNDGEY